MLALSATLDRAPRDSKSHDRVMYIYGPEAVSEQCAIMRCLAVADVDLYSMC